MKALPMKREDEGYVPCPAKEATHLRLELPGPFPNRFIPIILKGSRSRHAGTVWSWNGDTEKPTLRPSIKTWTDEHSCHTWINDGNVVFLDDCTHELAGKTLPLNDVE